MEKTTAKPCFPGKHYLAEGVPLVLKRMWRSRHHTKA